MTQHILDLMDQRRDAKQNRIEYRKINNEIRKKCKSAKEAWLAVKCQEIENSHRNNSHAMYKQAGRQK